jgi:hypothetical protein
LTPLFGCHDDQRLPRLDSFITAPPAESPTPTDSRTSGTANNTSFPTNKSSAIPHKSSVSSKSSTTKSRSKSVNSTTSKDPFDDFDFPLSTNFESSFNLKRQNLTQALDPFLQSKPNTTSSLEDDAISFPSLADPPSQPLVTTSVKANFPAPPTPQTNEDEEDKVLQAAAAAIAEGNQSYNKSVSPTRTSQINNIKKSKKKKRSKSGKKSSSKKDLELQQHQETNQMSHSDLLEDTPQPSSQSGMRFDELYRLRGVVSK